MSRSAAAILRTLVRIAAVIAVAILAHRLMVWAKVQSDLGTDDGAMLWLVLGVVHVVYAVLIALPFVPGIEIGLAILMMQGAAAAPSVYLATVAGLMLAYGAGYRLPPRWLAGIFTDLGLARAAGFLAQLERMTPAERLAALRDRLPARLGWLAHGWRFLLLAVLLNLPGNGILGGGGGIMLVAGLSGLFRPLPTLLTIALAVAPVPLLVWSLGLDMI